MGAKADFEVRQAAIADIELLSPLFDGYRQFYGRLSDLALARAFLLERFQHNQSVIFMAIQGTRAALGFAQLYPSFSSVAAARTFILNDLFVVAQALYASQGWVRDTSFYEYTLPSLARR